MADEQTAYFAVRFTDANGVENFYVTKTLGHYPTTAPAGAAPEMIATINALAGLLSGVAVTPVSADVIGPEGQMIG